MDISKLVRKHNLFEPGHYCVKVAYWYLLESSFGRHVGIRFDVVEERPTNRFIEENVDAVLTGGERPSRLYRFISALVFDGKPLPEGYSLETASLLHREASAAVALIDRDGLLFNRIAWLSPLQDSASEQTATGSPG
jgi:hypothetical protein